jgi:hypothetical protein
VYDGGVSLHRTGPLTARDHQVANAFLMPPVPQVHGKEVAVLLLYSMLYSVNIVVSNASLRLVTVPVRIFPSELSHLVNDDSSVPSGRAIFGTPFHFAPVRFAP